MPVYLTKAESKSLLGMPGGVLGHIDFVQVSGNTIYITDYKPVAKKQKRVQSQLFIYALALSKRAGIHLKHIKCSWFDDIDSFTVDAMELYKTYSQKTKTGRV